MTEIFAFSQSWKSHRLGAKLGPIYSHEQVIEINGATHKKKGSSPTAIKSEALSQVSEALRWSMG